MPSPGLCRIIAWYRLFPRILARTTRHSPVTRLRAMLGQALAKTAPLNASSQGRYRSDDELLAFLKALYGGRAMPHTCSQNLSGAGTPRGPIVIFPRRLGIIRDSA